MKIAKLVYLLAAAALALAAARAEAADPPKGRNLEGAVNSLAAFGWFGELAGTCWKAEHSGGNVSDRFCFSLIFTRLIKGEITTVNKSANGGESTFNGEGVFAADPERKRILFSQWGTNGVFSTGVVTLDGEKLVFMNNTADGSEPRVRSTWIRKGPDEFRVVRERREDSTWIEFLAVDYRRMYSTVTYPPGAAPAR